MLERPMTTQWLTRVILLTALSLFWAINAKAEEQRCNDLGANCICSEPFQMTSFSSGPDFWNPTDSTTKQCSVEAGSIGGAIVRTSNTITPSTDAPAMAALPTGHSVSRFVRAENDHQGTFFAGSGVPVSASFVRLAARFYIYHSPVFDFEGEGTCNNSKQVELNGDSRIDYNSGAGFHTYNYLQFSPPIDCCVSGPAVTQPQVAGFKGKWVRHEIVITNRSGPAYRLQSFMKNITDGTPEVAVIDTAFDSRVNNLTPPQLMSSILSNNHRFSASGSCRGWIGLSHYMMSGWTTNAGQRIGEATEVEPSGGIAAPRSLTVK